MTLCGKQIVSRNYAKIVISLSICWLYPYPVPPPKLTIAQFTRVPMEWGSSSLVGNPNKMFVQWSLDYIFV